MTIDRDGIRSALNDLIEICTDSEEGFRDAAAEMRDPAARALFMNYSRQRMEFAAELQAAAARIGGAPAQPDSIHRAWQGVKSALAGDDEHAILAEAERSEDSAIASYRTALGKDLPPDLRQIVQRQYREIERTHDSVRALHDRCLKRDLPMVGLV